jgi:hypothetical protein
MGELSFLTIIVSLAVCSILVFAMYQYMKVRFTILEHSQKEQALILQQYIEESSYDIQGLQSIVFRHAQPQQQPQHQAQSGAGSEPVEIFEDHNKHIHMDTVMYEAPNKQRSTLIAISSDSEDTTSDEGSEDSDGSESSGSESEGSEGSEGSESSEGSEDSESSEGSEDSESEIECDNDIHEVKHIEISLPTDNNVNELDVESVTVIHEASHEEPVSELPIETSEIKTVTVDLGISADTSSISTDTIDVLSLLNKTAEEHDVVTDHHFTVMVSASAPAPVPAAASTSFSGLSVVELRALLKEKYKDQPDKVPNLQKLKKPELVQLLQE